jgi:iron complex outermembrane receptor protein
MIRSAIGVSALAIAAAVSAASASAQEAAVPTTAEGAEAPRAEEIVVTGQRERAIARENRSASGLLDVPELEKPRSVLVIDQQTLRNQVFAGEQDLVRNIPGASDNSFGRDSGVRVSLRGLNAAIAIDGISTGGNSASIHPELIDAIEVQRGVNALETNAISFGFGGGAGGTINLLRKYPQADAFIEARVNGTQWGQVRGVLDWNQPLGSDNQGLRLIAAYGQNRTHYRDEPRLDYFVLGLSGTVLITENLILNAALDYTREQNMNSYNLSERSGEPTVLPRISARQSLTAPWSNGTEERQRAYLKATWIIDKNWALESNFRAERDAFDYFYYFFFGNDLATGETDTVWFYGKDPFAGGRTLTGDLRLKGEFSVGGVDNLLSVGINRYDQRFPNATEAFVPNFGTNNIFDWRPPLQRPELTADILNPPDGTITRVQDTSLFGQIRSTFADQIDLWLGGRYSRYSTNISGGDRSEEPARDAFFTPTVSLVWRPNGRNSVYATYAESIAPGLIVNPFYVNAGEVIPPQRIRQYEIGYKHQSRNWSATAALFEASEPRVLDIAIDAENDLFEQRADGLNRFRGVELTGEWRHKGFSIGAGYVYLDAVVRASNNPETIGNRAGGVPRHAGYVNAEYMDAFVPGLTIGGILRAQTSSLVQTQTFSTPGWTLLDAFVSYRFGGKDRPWTGRISAVNVLNRYHFIPTDGGFSFLPGLPRTVSFEIARRF